MRWVVLLSFFIAPISQRQELRLRSHPPASAPPDSQVMWLDPLHLSPWCNPHCKLENFVPVFFFFPKTITYSFSVRYDLFRKPLCTPIALMLNVKSQEITLSFSHVSCLPSSSFPFFSPFRMTAWVSALWSSFFRTELNFLLYTI